MHLTELRNELLEWGQVITCLTPLKFLEQQKENQGRDKYKDLKNRYALPGEVSAI